MKQPVYDVDRLDSPGSINDCRFVEARARAFQKAGHVRFGGCYRYAECDKQCWVGLGKGGWQG